MNLNRCASVVIGLLALAFAAPSASADSDPTLVRWYQDRYDVAESTANRRLELQTRGGELPPRLEKALGAANGGLYFDNLEGIFVISRTAEASDAAVAEVMDSSKISSSEYRVKAVQWSFARLQASAASVRKTVDSIGEQDRVEVVPSVTRNTLEISAAKGTSLDERVRESARSTGVDVSYSESGRTSFLLSPAVTGTCQWLGQKSFCNRANSYQHQGLRGGVAIQTSGSLCSLGALAKRRPATPGDPVYLVTSGHCLYKTGPGTTWSAPKPMTNNSASSSTTQVDIGPGQGAAYGSTYPSGSGRTGDSGVILLNQTGWYSLVINANNSAVYPWKVRGWTFVDHYEDEYVTTGVAWSYVGKGVCVPRQDLSHTC